MAIAAIKNLFSGVKPFVALLILLFVSLYLMSDATHSVTDFGKLYIYLIVINSLAIIILVGLIVRNLSELVQQYRQKVTGSRLTIRLVILFTILSVTPVSVVYYFSLDFLKRGIDSWFDVRIEQALNDSLELSQASLGLRMRDVLKQVESFSPEISQTPDDLAAIKLNEILDDSDAMEMTLFSSDGQIIAASSVESAKFVPVSLDESLHLRLKQESGVVGVIPVQDSGLFIRVAVLVPAPDPVAEARVLQVLYPITEHMNTLANTVQVAVSQFRESVYIRKPVKTILILTLTIILLLSLLTSIYAAFFFARRLVSPITDLVEGTRAVAAGNYEKRLPLIGKDELGFLVRSFNEMTQKISLATSEAKQSQQLLQEQHAYLEAVLTHLSSGVITLNNDMSIYTCNAAASTILDTHLDKYIGKTLNQLVESQPQLLIFVDMIHSHQEQQEKEWHEEITLFSRGGRQVLMCRGSVLPYVDDEAVGMVVVFDDITNLVQAQRNAAWGEVARRLAHEIKNPLTPIQLSAERLRHKLLKGLPEKDAQVLDRSTHTIVQQVETLKQMVKSFSDYARMPELYLTPVDVNSIINEVIDLFRHDSKRTHFNTTLDANMPEIEADEGRMRQLLNNLIKNAIEAMRTQSNSEIKIETKCMKKDQCRFIEIRISDTGPGIPEEVFGQLFDPYVTTKPKGSGLGLAIVKKIVDEHNGIIWAENADNGGAKIIIRLPVQKDDSETLTTITAVQHDDNDAAA